MHRTTARSDLQPCSSNATPRLGGTFAIGDDMPVHRLGYGTMQLTGPGHWSSPADPEVAKAILRRAVELGIDHIDTADAYGPETAEHLIHEALYPYPPDLVIATKGGLTRQGPNRWTPVGRPEYLRQCVEMSLRRLGRDRIDLYYLHRVDPQVPLADQVGALADMRQAGKIRHIGLSKVTVPQIQAARLTTDIAAVQNRFNFDEGDRDVLNYCAASSTAFVSYAPLAAGKLADETRADRRSTDAALKALGWLLEQSPALLSIPGTSSLPHLEENATTSSGAALRRKGSDAAAYSRVHDD